MTTTETDLSLPRRRRPSLGRPLAIRGLDLVHSPPETLGPLFEHEPLLRGVTHIAEPFCGKGRLVTAMRARGIDVYASDISNRGCPNSYCNDFFDWKKAPLRYRVLVSNPPYTRTMDAIEHAFAIGFRQVIFLLKTTFLHTEDRFERLHAKGHLRRVLVIAERVQDMHDEAHVARGGKLSSQPATHSWFVIDSTYRGPAAIVAVSLHRPSLRMPWEE
jgi:hypothetical protein